MPFLKGLGTACVTFGYVCFSFADNRPQTLLVSPRGALGMPWMEHKPHCPRSSGQWHPKQQTPPPHTHTHLTGPRAALTPGSLMTSGCLLPTLGWQSRPGKGAMATRLLSFESTGSGSCCQATLTLETAVGLPPLCAPAQRHQWAAGSSGGQAPVGEEGCPRPAPPDPAPPPYLIKPPQDQAHQRMIILSELCMVLYLREITFNDLDKIFVLCSGDFFPCCGFLVVPSSLAGVWGVPMVSCGLLPRQNQASEQAWPGPASLDASLVLDICYGQTCSAV